MENVKEKSVDNITKGECEYINIDELANDKKEYMY